MIEVQLDYLELTIKGHAGYAPAGQDIVCSAISVLTQTLVNTLDKTNKVLIEDMQDGSVHVAFSNMSQGGKLIIDSFYESYLSIATQYPKHVKMVQYKEVEQDEDNE